MPGAADAGDAGAGAPSFRTEVHPLLLEECGACHREGGPGAASKQYVVSDEASEDLPLVLALVDSADPDASPLLVKARGEMHTGGKVLPAESAGYATVRAWIAAGARP